MKVCFLSDSFQAILFSLEQIDVSDIPTKLDGTADMRYLQSREAVKSGLIGKDEVIEGKILLSLIFTSLSLSFRRNERQRRIPTLNHSLFVNLFSIVYSSFE